MDKGEKEIGLFQLWIVAIVLVIRYCVAHGVPGNQIFMIVVGAIWIWFGWIIKSNWKEYELFKVGMHAVLCIHVLLIAKYLFPGNSLSQLLLSFSPLLSPLVIIVLNWIEQVRNK